MKNKNASIRRMVSYLNNEEFDGGLWLPNIQRPFVWGEEQIERLFDSIMREYPISTLLVWKTKSGIKRRKFIDNYFDDLKLSRFQVPEDHKTKLLVLDGQQRLQSLFVGLKGSYNKRELFFDVLSGDQASPEDMRFRFRFMSAQKATFPWISFKQAVFTNEMPNDYAEKVIAVAGEPLSDDEKRRLVKNIWQAQRVFVNNEAISYQELDSVDNPDAYTEDDVVEIFIRANSGGTKLGKSDLLFSLLTASWEDADEAMEDLIAELNVSGYCFTRDFILKTCLVLIGKGAAYDVKKFRDEKTKREIVAKWEVIANAIKDVRDFLYGKTFIRSDHALPSYLALIPVIYYRYTYPDQWAKTANIDTYFLRTLLCGAFSGRPDGLIDKCTRRIAEERGFNLESIFEVIHNDGRNLDVSEETILNSGYGSRNIHLIFNLWYRQFNYQPVYDGNLPQVDHIFPQSLLRTVKEVNPEAGGRSLMRYPAAMRDRIANCMLLTAEENGFQNKNATPPDVWFADKGEDYLDLHLIPSDRSLWSLENYDRFVESREKMIVSKLHYLLTSNSADASSVTPDATRSNERTQGGGASDESYETVATSNVAPAPTSLSMESAQPSEGFGSDTTVGCALSGSEQLLEQYLSRVANPSKYIAGFRTKDGKELALERQRQVITIWTQQVYGIEDAGFALDRLYSANEPRNSNLNRKNCPNLRLGMPVAYWKLADTDELLDFINWYSEAPIRISEKEPVDVT